VWDNDYERFLEITKTTKEKEIKVQIHNMKRFVLPSGEEFIIHNQTPEKME
jgi:hypothetical protein